MTARRRPAGLRRCRHRSARASSCGRREAGNSPYESGSGGPRREHVNVGKPGADRNVIGITFAPIAQLMAPTQTDAAGGAASNDAGEGILRSSVWGHLLE